MRSLDVFLAKKKVTDYYESIRPKDTDSEFEQYIATDGDDVVIYSGDPENWPGDESSLLFYCEMRNGEVHCELMK